jgi:hypothetical protein
MQVSTATSCCGGEIKKDEDAAQATAVPQRVRAVYCSETSTHGALRKVSDHDDPKGELDRTIEMGNELKRR